MRPTARFTAATFVAISLLCSTKPARPDAITPVSPVETLERTFGDVRFVVRGPSKGLSGHSEWPEMYVGGDRVAVYPGFFAQEFYASESGNYFLALSNLGYSRYAYAVLDRTGAVLYSKPHNTGELFYCRASVSNLREWIDLKAPDVRFVLQKETSTSRSIEHLQSISVTGCRGDKIVLGERAKSAAAN